MSFHTDFQSNSFLKRNKELKFLYINNRVSNVVFEINIYKDKHVLFTNEKIYGLLMNCDTVTILKY